MVRMLLSWLVNAVAVYATAHLLDGISVRNFGAALAVALILGLINTVLRPILVFLSIPFLVVTLGLFMLVINALMLQLAAALSGGGFVVDSFWWAMLASMCISVVAWVLSSLLNV